ncbi:DUF934 domain-containing protein [Paraburkholderia sp. BCC1884]|uniref:DUF934 domain-containing protein n=1 Tax=Paraburkholderia sp. BCC1884 TaxID=2562668 RepID=UPI001181CA1B|nr:DUF934 domain-containing protein [Paraburkholderia sp. BCC1884]
MKTKFRIRLLTPNDQTEDQNSEWIRLSNDTDPLAMEENLRLFSRIELEFVHASDSQAYGQALLLRRRLRFRGDLRAVGEIATDQLMQLQGAGFSSVVLRDGTDTADVILQLESLLSSFDADASTEHVSW